MLDVCVFGQVIASSLCQTKCTVFPLVPARTLQIASCHRYLPRNSQQNEQLKALTMFIFGWPRCIIPAIPQKKSRKRTFLSVTNPIDMIEIAGNSPQFNQSSRTNPPKEIMLFFHKGSTAKAEAVLGDFWWSLLNGLEVG